jgi:hypothetical protein
VISHPHINAHAHIASAQLNAPKAKEKRRGEKKESGGLEKKGGQIDERIRIQFTAVPYTYLCVHTSTKKPSPSTTKLLKEKEKNIAKSRNIVHRSALRRYP